MPWAASQSLSPVLPAHTDKGPEQRLKGAIDRTIAEEQARQRTIQQAAPQPTTAAPRRSRSSSTAGTQSPARRPRPTKKPSEDLSSRDANGDGTPNPDPAVFEAAFVIDDMDDSAAPSRVATPSVADKDGKDTTPAAGSAPANGASEGQPAARDSGEAVTTAADQPANPASTATPATTELPTEVRARLRKLEKLEKTYPGSCRPSLA
jgi:hypothetical protein